MTSTTPLQALQHIRRMRGGAQSHLMRGSDGGYWVVKFTNNPQHVRILANEFLASRIGRCLGLPMPEVTPIEVSDWLIENTPELHIECAGFSKPCNSGLQLASRYIADPATDQVFDYLPESMSNKIMNIEDFPRCLVLDRWAGNCDGRQATFSRSSRYLGYKVHFIDQGYCFNAGEWAFPDLALQGVYYRNYVYRHVTGWESFEPTLSRAEQADLEDLWEVAEGLPEAWWNRDSIPEGMPKEWWNQMFPSDLTKLIETLYQRRSSIRQLITNFREHTRNPFPNWKNTPQVSVPAMSAESEECRA